MGGEGEVEEEVGLGWDGVGEGEEASEGERCVDDGSCGWWLMGMGLGLVLVLTNVWAGSGYDVCCHFPVREVCISFYTLSVEF